MATAYTLQTVKSANRTGDVTLITSSNDFPVKAVPSAKAFGERFPSESGNYRLVRRATGQIVRRNYGA